MKKFVILSYTRKLYKGEIKINDSIQWLLDYIKGIKNISSINADIQFDLQNNFGWISDKYDSSYNEYGILYRGLHFKNRLSLELFLKEINVDGFINLKCSSWTEDNIVAQNFMNGEGYNHYNKADSQNSINESFSIKISAEIAPENILFSYLTFEDWLKSTDIRCLKELEIVNNESEFLIKEGLYKIEIDMATIECKDILYKSLGKNHPSIRYTEFS